MARPVVGNPFDGQIGTVAPTARPVDTYERGVVKKSPFEALSRTLSNLEKKAVPALQREEARRAEAEYAEGQQLWADTRIQFGKAVKDGIIAEGESPYLRKGYRMANLNVISANYANDLKAQMEKKQLYKNGNPATIEKFITEFQANYADKNGLADFKGTETAEVFLPNAMKANIAFKSNWRTKHTSYMTTQIYKSFGDNISAYTYSITDQTIPMAERTKLAAGLQGFIEEQAAQADRDGLNRGKIGKIIGDSLRLSALENKSMAPLDMMNNIKLGTDPLASTMNNRLANIKTRATVAGLIDAAEDKADAQYQEDIDANISTNLENAQVAASGLISTNPSEVAAANEAIDASIAALQLIVPDDDTGAAAKEIVNIQKLRKTFSGYTDAPEDTSDGVAYFELVQELEAEPDHSKRTSLIAQGVEEGFVSQSQVQTLFNQGYTSKDNDTYARVSAGSSVVQTAFKRSLGLMLGDPSFLKGAQKSEAAALQLRVRNALSDDMTQWLERYEETNGTPASDRELEIETRGALTRLIDAENKLVSDLKAAEVAAAQAKIEADAKVAARKAEQNYNDSLLGSAVNAVTGFFTSDEVPDFD